MMNWDDLRIFLAIAEAGSLSAAARRLGVNQSTVSRRLAAMEAGIGTELVQRGRGWTLTVAGHELADRAARIAGEIAEIDRRLAGEDARLTGRLRVTSVDMLVGQYLAPHLAAFAACHPGLALDLVTPLAPLDLGQREADVAIRVSDDPPGDLVGRRVAGFALGVYGAAALAGTPDPAALPWVGWVDPAPNRRMIEAFFPEAAIVHRADTMSALAALVGAGLGVSVFPCYWADRDPRLRRIVPLPLATPKLGIWVLTHPDLRRAARVRAFMAFIGDVLHRDRDLFQGSAPQAPA